MRRKYSILLISLLLLPGILLASQIIQKKLPHSEMIPIVEEKAKPKNQIVRNRYNSLCFIPYPTTIGVDENPKVCYSWLAGYTEGYVDVDSIGTAAFDYYGNSGIGYNNPFGLSPVPGFTLEPGTFNYIWWTESPNPFYNDNGIIPITVYPEGEYELGYNSRMLGDYYYPGCTGAVTYFTPFTDSLLTGTHNITGVRHLLYNRHIPSTDTLDTPEYAPLTFKVYNANPDTTLGTLIYEEEIIIPSTQRIKWTTIPFSEEIAITEDFFILITGEFVDGITNPDHPKYFMLVDDNTAYLLGESYYAGHSFNYVDTLDVLEDYPYDFYCNALINVIVAVDPENEIDEESIFLYQNYPNPFSGSTTISFLATDLHNLSANWRRLAQVKIYNIKGELIKQLSILNSKSSIKWDGKDENNRQLSNGIYFYRLIIDNKIIDTKKCVILR